MRKRSSDPERDIVDYLNFLEVMATRGSTRTAKKFYDKILNCDLRMPGLMCTPLLGNTNEEKEKKK